MSKLVPILISVGSLSLLVWHILKTETTEALGTPVSQPEPMPSPEPVVEPVETPVSQPKPLPKKQLCDLTALKADLWKYYPDTSVTPYVARNYQDYIETSNVIKCFADHISFKTWGDDGLTIYLDDKPLRPTYRSDDARLFREADQKLPSEYKLASDFWQNPSYYACSGFEGDCEDYALFIASIMEVEGIPYMIYGGAHEGVFHVWATFVYDNKTWVADVNYRPRIYNPKVLGYVEWWCFNKHSKLNILKELVR